MNDEDGIDRGYTSNRRAFQPLCNYRKAIECHEKDLKTAKETGDRAGEGRAYGSLGNAYQLLGDYQKAIEYHEKRLKIAKEIGDRAGEGGAYGGLGIAYNSLGDYQRAIEYHEKDLKVAKEIGDRVGEGRAHGSLGIVYESLGYHRKAIEYHEERLKIAKEISDRAGEGRGYKGLGIAHRSLGYYQRAIEYHEEDLEIAKEIGDSAGQGQAYGNLGVAYQLLGDYQKAIEYHEKHLKIAKEIGDRAGEGGAYGNLGVACNSLCDFQKAIEYHEKHLKIAKEIGDRDGERTAYYNFGNVYFSLEQFENAVENFAFSLKVFILLRSLLKSKDNLKMKFRKLHQTTYTALCRSLLKIGKVDEALFMAEQGRAQTLFDNLLIHYKLPASLSAAYIDTGEAKSRLFTELSAPTIFLAIEGLTINIWFLRREKKLAFRQGRLEGDRRDEDPIRVLLETAFKNIEAEANVRYEHRTFGELENECPCIREVRNGKVRNSPLPSSDNPFRPIYDGVIAPIVDLLEPQDDEMVIVPDGALCFTPWAAVIESIRIRTVPSLTSYQLILNVPESHHKKTGALLVGNPCLKELKRDWHDLPCAQEEVELIASILNTTPLVGRQATKAEVIKQMSSVGLIHIAAPGNEKTGEIILSPNPGCTSKFPRKKDFILKMSDVKAANLRARLVVLSYSNSGRGKMLKGEGVVGIARAFLEAGARSVLVALWEIDDKATMVFMKSFYQHLMEGKTASTALHQSMKSLRESEEFRKMSYWALFQLIGDDVKIEFEVDVKKGEK